MVASPATMPGERQYGTRFMSYLAIKYGPEKFVQWQSRSEDSKAFYATQFKYVFGRRLDDVWNDWIRFEHEFQQANLAAIQARSQAPHLVAAPDPAGKVLNDVRGFIRRFVAFASPARVPSRP